MSGEIEKEGFTWGDIAVGKPQGCRLLLVSGEGAGGGFGDDLVDSEEMHEASFLADEGDSAPAAKLVEGFAVGAAVDVTERRGEGAARFIETFEGDFAGRVGSVHRLEGSAEDR